MTEIPKNLKVGDTYVDEYTFEIYHVCNDGTYWAKRVDINERPHAILEKKAEQVKKEIKEEKVETLEYSKTQINRLPNAELEKLCKKLGVEVGTGTEMKRALIAKLGL